jgi:CHAT domain-containing protein
VNIFPAMSEREPSLYQGLGHPSSPCAGTVVSQSIGKMTIGLALLLAALISPQTYAQSNAVRGEPTVESIFSRIAPHDCQTPSSAELNEVSAAVNEFRRRNDKANQARSLTLLASLYEEMGHYGEALPPLRRALALVRLEKDHQAAAQVLTLTADALNQLGDSDKAFADATEALKIGTELRSNSIQASALRARAEALATNQPEKALKDLKVAQHVSEMAADLKTEAQILTDEGELTQDSSDPFETFQQALTLESQIQDCRDEAATLSNLATLEHDRGQLRKAYDHLSQSAAANKQSGDLSTQAKALHQSAYFHAEIGDLGQALSLFNEALQLEQQAGDKAEEGPTMAALAGIYRDAQWPQTALRAYQRALPLLRQQGNTYWEIIVLNNLGATEADLHQTFEARKAYMASVALASAHGDPVTPAYSSWGIGELEQADALPHYFQALRLAREFGQPSLEGNVYASLMDHFRAHHQEKVAIFFAKQAVDVFQSLRRNMTDTGNDLQSAFLHRKAATYRTLAGMLIDQGRLIEAHQTIDLLKVQQYADYVGGQPEEFSQHLPRSATESALQTEFEDLLTKYATLDKASRPADGRPNRQVQPASPAVASLRSAQKAFDSFLPELYRRLEASEGPAAAVQDRGGIETTIAKLVRTNPHLAVIYTLEEPDRYSAIVTTGKGQSAYSYAIAQDELDQKCRQFLEALKSPTGDSSKLAPELYQVLFAPMQKDLAAANVTTLVWNLDGSLRYIPIAALFNQQTGHYVIEDYSVVSFTPLSHSLADAPHLAGVSALAMGTSSISLDGLSVLPNVPVELNSVVSDPDVSDSHGVLPGKILLNGQFTEAAMQRELHSQAVVHIASHFVLRPGNDDLSFLLLGGQDHDSSGYRYSMAEFEKSSMRLEGTKLLTFSACETGASNEREICFQDGKSSVIASQCRAGDVNQREDGVVMESISEVALEKGAEAVLSSLWSVDDASTSEFMADFYRRWAGSGGTISKAEALQQAELDLLHGLHSMQGPAGERGSKLVHGDLSAGSPARFSRPYFWAPFVLTGNWQ